MKKILFIIALCVVLFVGLIIGLGLLGTGLAYIIYYYIVDRLGAVTASSASWPIPA